MKRKLRRQMGVVGVALVLDVTLGDPPNRWHPVAWMGTLISWLRRCVPVEGRIRPLLGGGVITFGGGGVVWGIGRMLTCLPEPLCWLVEAVLLKMSFSLRGLFGAAGAVKQALQVDDLPQARHWLGWHLVSRDTSGLDASQVAAATIESLAENLSDGVIAPLFYYRLGGLPAALAYRYLNTGDAMLGYRDAAREWLGKVPARTDDVLNWVPARLTAGGILLTAVCQRLWRRDDWRRPVQVYCRYKNRTDSPNAGQPMSAMAGALGVALEKAGQYCLGRGQRAPQSADIRGAMELLLGATAVCLGLLFLWPSRGDDDSF